MCIRDRFLARAAIDSDMPLLAICRGHQVLNVAFGGTLYQDIATDVVGARVHRDPAPYDKLVHEIDIEPGSALATLYGGVSHGLVNSVHHQAVKSVGKNVVVEARSREDGIVEAIRVEGAGYVRGVQWHPEFAHPTPAGLLDSAPILREFLAATELRRHASRRQA